MSGAPEKEIEITDEMADAGGKLVDGFNPEFDLPWVVAAEVYRTMERIRVASCDRGSLPQQGSKGQPTPK
ncbi:hypothetical protein FJ414_02405 [Mesorhizobium sp. B3-1-6]|uniref:hypothetical protein n=1 Tax=Mesorhizobium sp. B3-1-6 TaxID=2589895 RepID=UPI0011268273|nr:hypothetical protein [Mesorhizobium sp. B3-1-6]TPI43690.1 hypothetical protein FJ414_02405 [Mesorhizobium sp. B3-1-6]